MRSLNALLAGRKAEAASLMREFRIEHESEGLFYFARHYSQMGMADDALALIDLASKAGFNAAPETLMHDPALAALRNTAATPTFFAQRKSRFKKRVPVVSR